MKTFARSFLFVVLFVFVATSVAAQENTKVDPVVQIKAIVGYLRAESFNQSVCHLYDRHKMAEGLQVVIRAQGVGGKAEITEAEIKTLQSATAKSVIDVLFRALDSELEVKQCVFQLPTEGSFYKLSLGNDYEIVQALRLLLKKYPEMGVEYTSAGVSEIVLHVGLFAQENGREITTKWFEKKDEEAGKLLYKLMVEEGVAPSILGLNEKQTFTILETYCAECRP